MLRKGFWHWVLLKFMQLISIIIKPIEIFQFDFVKQKIPLISFDEPGLNIAWQLSRFAFYCRMKKSFYFFFLSTSNCFRFKLQFRHAALFYGRKLPNLKSISVSTYMPKITHRNCFICSVTNCREFEIYLTSCLSLCRRQ